MPRTAWISIAGCLFVLLIVIPIVAPDHEIDVVALAIWGGTISVLTGLLSAGTWIMASHGRPFGQRDIALDRESPYLRRSRRWGRWLASGFVFVGAIGCGFAVYWYPNPYPYLELQQTPEDYILGILAGAWFFLLFGTCWLVLEIFWSAVLRRDETGSTQLPIDTS